MSEIECVDVKQPSWNHGPVSQKNLLSVDQNKAVKCVAACSSLDFFCVPISDANGGAAVCGVYEGNSTIQEFQQAHNQAGPGSSFQWQLPAPKETLKVGNGSNVVFVDIDAKNERWLTVGNESGEVAIFK
jgi:hypothetical protein